MPLGTAARRLLDGGDPDLVRRLLEPLFRGAPETLDERFEEALDALCDAYALLEEPRKKHALLERIARTGSPALRVPALQRLATVLSDADRYEEAWAAFQGSAALEPAVRFGAVLAWYRKGEPAKAARELKEAVRFMPLVPAFLIPTRKAQPKLSKLGVTAGGPDEAWLYRADMREVWAGVPGLLDWLKRTAR